MMMTTLTTSTQPGDDEQFPRSVGRKKRKE
jgi:hypothetical protein